jgi:hypothetical protein
MSKFRLVIVMPPCPCPCACRPVYDQAGGVNATPAERESRAPRLRQNRVQPGQLTVTWRCPQRGEHVRDRTWQDRILPRPPVLGDVHPGSPEKAQHVIMRNAGVCHSVTPAFEAAADQRGIGQSFGRHQVVLATEAAQDLSAQQAQIQAGTFLVRHTTGLILLDIVQNERVGFDVVDRTIYDGTREAGTNRWAAVLRNPQACGIRVIETRLSVALMWFPSRSGGRGCQTRLRGGSSAPQPRAASPSVR